MALDGNHHSASTNGGHDLPRYLLSSPFPRVFFAGPAIHLAEMHENKQQSCIV